MFKVFDQECLKQARVFKDCSTEFVEMLTENVSNKVYQAGDIIFNQGDFGDSMFILNRGEVTVHIDTKAEPVAKLSDGAVFGEMSVICKGFHKRTATIKASSLCDCRVIDRDALLRTNSRYPSDAAIIETEARRRMDDLRTQGLIGTSSAKWYALPGKRNRMGTAVPDEDHPRREDQRRAKVSRGSEARRSTVEEKKSTLPRVSSSALEERKPNLARGLSSTLSSLVQKSVAIMPDMASELEPDAPEFQPQRRPETILEGSERPSSPEAFAPTVGELLAAIAPCSPRQKPLHWTKLLNLGAGERRSLLSRAGMGVLDAPGLRKRPRSARPASGRERVDYRLRNLDLGATLCTFQPHQAVAF